jgi:hypothetical protein
MPFFNAERCIAKVKPDPHAYTGGRAIVLPQGIISSPENFTLHDYTVVDPMDMKAVDELFFSLVMAERSAMGSEGTLYVVIGEAHPMAAHRMVQTGLIENIATQYKKSKKPNYRPALMVEMPFNDLAVTAEQEYQLTVSHADKYNLHRYDPSGHLFARSILSDNPYTESPEAQNRLFATALHYHIPILPIDAAKMDAEDAIDPNCEIYGQVVHEYYPDLAEAKIGTLSRVGTDVRNGVMAKRISDKAIENNTGIALVNNGLHHLGRREIYLGSRLSVPELPFKTSLPARLSEKIKPNDRILSVFLSSTRDTPEQVTPPGSHPKITPVVLRGLAENKFYAGDKKRENQFIAELGESYRRRGFFSQIFGSSNGIPKRFDGPTTSQWPSKTVLRPQIEALLELCPG